MPVHVSPSGESVELGIGEPSGGKWLVTALSLPQAETVLHASRWPRPRSGSTASLRRSWIRKSTGAE